MNLKNHKLIEETDGHFHVQNPDGEAFKVAKSGLKHSTVQAIQQHFADGGEVKEDDAFAERAARSLRESIEGDALAPPAPLARDPGMVAGWSDAPYQPPAPAPVAGPAGEWIPPSPADKEPPPDVAPEPMPVTQPAAKSAPAIGLPRASPELTAGLEQQRKGMEASARDSAATATEQARLIDQRVAQEQQMAQKAADTTAQRQAGGDQLFNDVLTSKVDPERFWTSRSTAQKAGTIVGMILGGIGSGLTGQPNIAVQMLEKSIDRDVEAQKLDIGKKGSLISHYMQQTQNIQSAQRLAKADMLDAYAGQMQAAAARGASKQAGDIAQMEGGKLRAQAVGLRMADQSAQMQQSQQVMGLSLAKQQQEAMGQLLKGISGGGGFDRRLLEMPGFEHYRERAVDLPDGTVGFADTKEAATEASKSMQHVGAFKSKLRRYRQMLESGNPSTLDRGAAQSMRADLLAEAGHLHDLNRLSDKDLELFEKQIPDISSVTSNSAWSRQALDALGKSVDDKVWSVNQRILHRQQKQRPQ